MVIVLVCSVILIAKEIIIRNGVWITSMEISLERTQKSL